MAKAAPSDFYLPGNRFRSGHNIMSINPCTLTIVRVERGRPGQVNTLVSIEYDGDPRALPRWVTKNWIRKNFTRL